MGVETETVERLDGSSLKTLNWLALLVLTIGPLMAELDSSIVNVALPKMMAVFNVSATSVDWILTAYMLTMGVTMPLSGFLGDNFGYKRCFFAALALFTLGSALCAAAWNFDILIVARVVQGIGGGLIMPSTMAILYKICPRERIGIVMGICGIAGAAAPAMGPILGGFLVQNADWRIIFSINLPLGIIALWLTERLLQETELIKGAEIDIRGIILSMVGFFTLLLALDRSNSKGWTDPEIVILLLVGSASLILFVVNELRVKSPILELRLYAMPVFALASLVNWVLQGGLNGAVFLEPILIQNVLGQTPLTSGLITFPAVIATSVMMPISGWIYDRYGVRTIAIVGVAITTWTTYMMHTFNAVTPFWVMTVWMMLRGFGLGLCMQPIGAACLNAVPEALVGRASASFEVSNQIFSSLGIAFLATLMQTRKAFHYARLAATVHGSGYAFYQLQNNLQGLTARTGKALQGMSATILAGQAGTLSAVQAIDDCFLLAAAACAVGLAACFLLREGKAAASETP